MTAKNYSYSPDMGEEGIFEEPLPKPPDVEEGEIWYKNLKPYERLYYHQTLNSVRKNIRFVQTPLIPRDDLDYVLAARYNHALEIFPDKVDCLMQRETANEKTFRRLRNTVDVIEEEEDVLGHPLKIGGIKEKISPHSVKLISSGPHTQLTNPGYSRQERDGNIFKY